MGLVARSIDEMAQGAAQRMTETATILQNQKRVIDGVRFQQQHVPAPQEVVMQQHDPRLDRPSDSDPFAKAYDDRRRTRIPVGGLYRMSRNPVIPSDLGEHPEDANPPNASTAFTIDPTTEVPWVQLNQPQSMLTMPELVPHPTFDPPRYYSCGGKSDVLA